MRQLTALTVNPRAPKSRINCPTLVVRGADDQRITLAAHHNLLSHLPTADTLTIEQAAHFIPAEQPQQLAHDIHQFIQRLIKYASN